MEEQRGNCSNLVVFLSGQRRHGVKGADRYLLYSASGASGAGAVQRVAAFHCLYV